MRDQGRLTNWDDDKGFGFVTPDNGGLRAENVLFREQPKPQAEPEPTGLASAILLVTGFIGAVVVLMISGMIPWLALAAYVVMSLITFTVYAFDKSAAMNRRWRTQEKTLQFLSLLGGWPGALIAQRLFHHKSKKASFRAEFWVIVVLHFAALIGFATGFFDTNAITRSFSHYDT